MSDSFSETTSRSWFARIKSAFTGIITGIVLVVGSCILLFWNEGRAVKTQRALEEGAGAVISVDASKLDPANESKLVHIAGSVKVVSPPSDPVFASLSLPANTIAIERQVEMYQWKENRSARTEKQLGGGEKTVTTYSYERTWSARRIDSGSFKRPGGHENPQFLVNSHEATAKQATLGAFNFRGSTLSGLAANQSLAVSNRTVSEFRNKYGFNRRARLSGDTIYVGRDPSQPTIGDMKIRFVAKVADKASVVGVQKSGGLVAYRASNGRSIFLTKSGIASAAEMFADAQSANTTLTWILRIAGVVAMFIGFRMIFALAGVLGDIIPFIGDMFRFATGFISLALTFVVAPVVIAVAWIAYRPLVAILVLLVGLGIAAAFLFVGKSKARAAAQTAPETG